MQPRDPLRAARRVLGTEWTGALVGLLGVLAVFGPGLLTPDSTWMLDQARTDTINDWLSPVPIWLIRTLHLRGSFVFAATTLAFFIVVARLLCRGLPRWLAGAVAALVGWSPPVLGWLSALGRDTWFGIAALASVLIVTSDPSPRRGRCAVRWGLLAVGLLGALCARQNAAPVVLVLLLIEFHERLPRSTPRRRWVLAAVGSGVLTAGLLLAVSSFTDHVIRPARTAPEQVTYVSDLAAMSLDTGEALVPADVWYGAPDYERLSAVWDDDDGTAIYNVENPPIRTITDGLGTLRRRWLSAIVHHPVPYVHRRASLIELQLFESTERCDPYVPGMIGTFPGHTLAHPHRATVVIGWEATFWRITGLRVWHLVVLSFIAAWFLRRTEHARLAWTLQAVSGVAILSLVPTAAVCAYRFTWLSVVASLVTIALATGHLPPRRRYSSPAALDFGPQRPSTSAV